jgi:hypothetical protein
VADVSNAMPVIRIWPNPATESVNISMNVVPGDDYRLELSDVEGRLWREMDWSQQTTLDLTELPVGLYLISVLNGKGNVVSVEKVFKK